MPSPPTTVRAGARIRGEFLAFFEERHGHALVPSSPVVPRDDPTLLFTNAGMNQFKDVFLGRGDRPYTRAVNSQKCIRAGGKHNDLEDVGKDTYHHTFFEMLGNWSFGDYFKAEAIEWAWHLLTEQWGLDRDRLYVTVYEGSADEGLAPDDEAASIWANLVPAERVSRWGRKDNFWEMGETGPCGPCSEIHYDGRDEAERAAIAGADLVNRGHPDVIEIWNLVFIQFDRGANGRLVPLPARHVDTGMGLERLVRVLQGKRSNYATDLWTPIFDAISAKTGAHPYGDALDDPVDVAYRVIADHARCLTVAIADGALPGSEGRGYVLRRILRRAVRHAHQTLGVDGPLLCDVVPAVVATLAEPFPEVARDAAHVAGVVRDEEEAFLRTLDRGIALFDDAAGAARRAHGDGAAAAVIAAESAFKLHDTFGFPIDLTRVMADERGLRVDEPGYEALMEEARERSRRGASKERRLELPPDAIARLKHLGVRPTPDLDKYHGRPLMARVEAIWNGADFDEVAHTGSTVGVVLDRTNHYAEAGGQVGDRGALYDAGRFDVQDVHAFAGYVLHEGRVADGAIRVGAEVEVVVERDRRLATMANHTGTHLLNHALREVLGGDTDQRGSLVAPDRLRFDFACAHPMSDEQIERTEGLVNEAIARAWPVHADVVPLERAMRINGLRAVFGERYPDPVRVVSVGVPVADLLASPDDERWLGHSIELCGGTHLARTDEARRLVIVSEQALASGVRRIMAVTGAAAEAAALGGLELEERARATASLEGEALADAHDEVARLVDELTLPARCAARVRAALEAAHERVKAARRSARSETREGAVDQARAIAARAEASGAAVIVDRIDDADKDALLPAMDVIRARCPDAAAMLFAPDEGAGRVAIAAAVPAPLIARGLKAGDWVREAAKTCGGGGGGRADLAQAGGKEPAKVGAAMDAARAFAERALA